MSHSEYIYNYSVHFLCYPVKQKLNRKHMFLLPKPLLCQYSNQKLQSSYFFPSSNPFQFFPFFCHLDCLVQSNLFTIKISINIFSELIGSYSSCSEITEGTITATKLEARPLSIVFQAFRDLASAGFSCFVPHRVLYLSKLLTLIP